MASSRPTLGGIVVFATAIASACVSPTRPPASPSGHVLAVGEASVAVPPATDGPLAVAFAGPKGKLTQGAEISVLFNKPMRPLGAAPSEPAPPATLRPSGKGAFHWIGSSALRFDAEEPLAPAT